MSQFLTALDKYTSTVAGLNDLRTALEAGHTVVAGLEIELYPYSGAARHLARVLEISYAEARATLDEVACDPEAAVTILAVRIHQAARRHVRRTVGEPGDGKNAERVNRRIADIQTRLVNAVNSVDERQVLAFRCATRVAARMSRALESTRRMRRHIVTTGHLDASIPARTGALRAEVLLIFDSTQALTTFLSGTALQMSRRSSIELMQTRLATRSLGLESIVRTPLAPAPAETVARDPSPRSAPRSRDHSYPGVPGTLFDLAVWVIRAEDRDRYHEEWSAELHGLRQGERRRYVISLVRGAIVLRLQEVMTGGPD